MRCVCENVSVVSGLLLGAEHLISTTVIQHICARLALESLGWLACIYNHMVVLQVSQHHPPSQYVHAQQTVSGQLHPALGQQPLASGQLQSAPGQLQAGQAHQHSAPGHLQPAPGQPDIMHAHVQTLSQLGSYIDLRSPTQSMSRAQSQPHLHSQPGSQVLSPCLGELFFEQVC